MKTEFSADEKRWRCHHDGVPHLLISLCLVYTFCDYYLVSNLTQQLLRESEDKCLLRPILI